MRPATTTGDRALDDAGNAAIDAILAAPADPYPYYATLHALGPVYSRTLDMWVFSDYASVSELLRNADLWQAPKRTPPGVDADASPYLRNSKNVLVYTNPPQHTRLRAILQRAFTPKVIDTVKPRIAEYLTEHLDRCAAAGAFDLVDGIARALPCQVICALLGVPREHEKKVIEWSNAISAGFTPRITPEVLDAADRAVIAFDRLLRELIEQHRREPQADVLSTLVTADDVEGRLDDDEIVSFAIQLLAAGSETTTNLISTGVLLLSEHPDLVRRMLDDAAVAGAVVEELLRWEPPVQMAGVRRAAADTTVGGIAIPAGGLAAGLIGAANHDPTVFPDPTAFSIDRPRASAHLAFGQGAHYCLGASLARAEATVALPAIFRRMPNLRIVSPEPAWRPMFTVRGLTTLIVEADGRPRT